MDSHGVSRARSQDAGFTFIEVMISVLLTAIAVIGMIALFRINSNAAMLSRHQTEASVLANDKLETLRTSASTSLTVGGPYTEGPMNEQGTTVSGARYTRDTYIAASSGSMFSVRVVVSWDEDGTTKSVTVRGIR
jgi:Tfp pilus assembly protein PilV